MILDQLIERVAGTNPTRDLVDRVGFGLGTHELVGHDQLRCA